MSEPALKASRTAYDGKPQMLSGVEPESERSRSGRGICETVVRYSYVCHGTSDTPRIRMDSFGTPSIRRTSVITNDPIPAPTVTKGTSTTGMPAAATAWSDHTLRSMRSSVRSPLAPGPAGASASAITVPGKWIVSLPDMHPPCPDPE